MLTIPPRELLEQFNSRWTTRSPTTDRPQHPQSYPRSDFTYPPNTSDFTFNPPQRWLTKSLLQFHLSIQKSLEVTFGWESEIVEVKWSESEIQAKWSDQVCTKKWGKSKISENSQRRKSNSARSLSPGRWVTRHRSALPLMARPAAMTRTRREAWRIDARVVNIFVELLILAFCAPHYL